ncbi:MAG: hypothetical protein ACYTF8_02275 [Planctomycetota bacterium]|jgi:hypothetical protein
MKPILAYHACVRVKKLSGETYAIKVDLPDWQPDLAVLGKLGKEYDARTAGELVEKMTSAKGGMGESSARIEIVEGCSSPTLDWGQPI